MTTIINWLGPVKPTFEFSGHEVVRQTQAGEQMTHITIERNQVKQWLEALKDIDALHHSQEPESIDAQKAIADMEQALAQPSAFRLRDVYTNPPQRTWVDLPHKDILDVLVEHNVYGSKWIEFARAVLAKSKEKNT